MLSKKEEFWIDLIAVATGLILALILLLRIWEAWA